MSRAFLVITAMVAVTAGLVAVWPMMAPAPASPDARAVQAGSDTTADPAPPPPPSMATRPLSIAGAAMLAAAFETPDTAARDSLDKQAFSFAIPAGVPDDLRAEVSGLQGTPVRLTPWLIVTPSGVAPTTKANNRVEIEPGSELLVVARALDEQGAETACPTCRGHIFRLVSSPTEGVPPALVWVAASGMHGEPGKGRSLVFGMGRPGFSIEETVLKDGRSTTDVRLFEALPSGFVEHTAQPIRIAASNAEACRRDPAVRCYDITSRWSVGGAEPTDLVVQYEGTLPSGQSVRSRVTWRLRDGEYRVVDGRVPDPAT